MTRYTETTVEHSNGDAIWYRRLGEGKPALVLCDGVGCDGYIWKYLIPHFEKQHTIIHWNYPGHGHTPPPRDLESLDIEEFAEIINLVLDDAGIEEPAVIMGHSMGVQVILEFYHRYPERCQALICVTGSCGRALDHVHDTGLVKKLFPYMQFVVNKAGPLVAEVWRRLVHTELSFQYATNFEINGKLIRREDFYPYLAHLSKMDPQVFIRTVQGAARHSAEHTLADIKVPTLIVAGEADRFTPHWISRRMQTMIPESEILTLPQGTHTGPLELPELLNLRVEKFLGSLSE